MSLPWPAIAPPSSHPRSFDQLLVVPFFTRRPLPHSSRSQQLRLNPGATRRAVAAVRSATSQELASRAAANVAILWFKKDLRLDDHPGLCSASKFDGLLPVYVFDPFVLRGWDLALLESLVEAVKDLKSALQRLGSDLILRNGCANQELIALAREVHASVIITEEEVEHEWIKSMSFLNGSYPEFDVQWKVKTWSAPLYKLGGDFPSSYKEFQRLLSSIQQPLLAPNSLPAVPNVLDKGFIPSASEIADSTRVSLGTNDWLKDIQIESVKSKLKSVKKEKEGISLPGNTETKGGMLRNFNSWRERYILASPYEALEKRREELALSSRNEEALNMNGAGTTTTQTNLDAYLRFFEPTWRNDWKKVHEAIMAAESSGPRGSSFRKLFGHSLTLGTISRRRIYCEAIEYEKSRNGGLSSPFGFSTYTAAVAVQEVKSAEWHRMLAAATKVDSVGEKLWNIRTWCWRGFLIQYTKMGEHGSPILLIHGFGAFWEHYRDNIKALAQEGQRVWALTLLGFGRSEKPDVVYTQDLWAELIRDFIIEVVGEPVVLVGNSIGGYMVSMVSGIWPELVRGLILLNTAGALVPDYSSYGYVEPKKRTFITKTIAQLSLIYLRSAARKILQRYYCTNPSRVDNWLTEEIIRASHDPGAAFVLESVLCINNPFPLNWFTDRYKGKIYVIQGMKDPLNNNAEKVKLFEAYCKNSVIKMIEAGHCPHDEVPEEINRLIINWLRVSHTSKECDSSSLPSDIMPIT